MGAKGDGGGGESKQEHKNLARQPLKTLFLYYHIAYGHQTWQGGD